MGSIDGYVFTTHRRHYYERFIVNTLATLHKPQIYAVAVAVGVAVVVVINLFQITVSLFQIIRTCYIHSYLHYLLHISKIFDVTLGTHSRLNRNNSLKSTTLCNISIVLYDSYFITYRLTNQYLRIWNSCYNGYWVGPRHRSLRHQLKLEPLRSKLCCRICFLRVRPQILEHSRAPDVGTGIR